MRLLPLACALLLAVAQANGPDLPAGNAGSGNADWQVQTLAGIDVHHVAVTAPELAALAPLLRRAVSDLQSVASLSSCPAVSLFVHPDLASYQAAARAKWFQVAIADRQACRLDTQRLAVVAQHGGVEQTLRHELHHLAQPDGWERWRAEGEAQRFAGERPSARPFNGLSPQELEALLAAPATQEVQLRAMATAYQWVMLGR